MQKTILISGQSNLAVTTGGAITVYRQFIEMLVKQEYRVIATWDSPDKAIPQWDIPGVELINTYYRYEGITQVRESFNLVVKEKSPDLIVFFFPALYLYAHLKREFRHIPRILMFHSRPDFYFAVFPSLKRRLRKYYINTHAQILMESFRPLLPSYIRRGPVHVISNSVIIPASQVSYELTKRKMVFFSRLDSLKGADLAIDAMSIVSRKHPDWVLDLYGDIEPLEYRATLQAQIDRLGLNSHVFIKGLSPLSPAETLLNYDFCLFPSRFEGFSLGLAECMASGLACIGLNNASGVNEMILDSYNGILVDDNPMALAEGIFRLIENPSERAQMGGNARTSMKQFSPDSIQSQWLTLIAGILNPRPRYPLKPVKELVKLI